MALTAEFIRRTRDSGKDVKVIAGCDILILSTLVYGGVGALTSKANIVPELVVEIYDKYMTGDIVGALDAQYRLMRVPMVNDLSKFPVVTNNNRHLPNFGMGGQVK